MFGKTRAAMLITVTLLVAQPGQGQVYRYEAETGQFFGTYLSTSVPGYSGTGYVTGFDSGSGTDYVRLQVDVPAGLYEMWVGYRSPFGPKGYNFQVDQQLGSGMFDQSLGFSVDRAGLFSLSGGTNTLAITENWGYYDVDYWEFRPFTPPPLLPVPAELVDPLATPGTRQLMNYLASQYGEKTLSGQQGDIGQNGPFPVQDYLNKSGGVVPAIRGSDFMDYSPSRIARGANPNGESERVINWAQQTGGIVTMMWHWNAPTGLVNSAEWPWWRGFYTEATTFDLPAALANPGGNDYQLLLRDIDAIATELEKFDTAGVPVLWRPLHESQGGWFWWGAHGPEAFKDLWHLMYERLTDVHGLHNLIWEFTSSAAEGNHLDWYPGDDVVDIVGLDIYTDPSANMSGQWYDILQHYNGRKMVTLSETGTLPDPDEMDLWNIKWGYVSPWTWDFMRNKYLNEQGYSETQLQAALQGLLGHEDILTLAELPILPWSNLAPALPGDYNFDGSVGAADFAVWRDSLGQTGAGLAADGNGNGEIDAGDYDVWKLYFRATSASAASLPDAVPEPATVVYLALGCVLLAAVRATSGGRRFPPGRTAATG